MIQNEQSPTANKKIINNSGIIQLKSSTSPEQPISLNPVVNKETDNKEMQEPTVTPTEQKTIDKDERKVLIIFTTTYILFQGYNSQ